MLVKREAEQPDRARRKKMEIKSLRTASGMTQKAFAEYFGIPKRNIENWESGRTSPPQGMPELMEYKLRHEGLI